MSTLPNRISAFGSMTPGREVALARQLLEIQSEQELDHFLPLLAMAAPLISNIAGPLLKNLAGGLFGGGSKKRKPRDQQEYFLGGIVKGLLGGELETSEYENEAEFQNESEAESYEREQFLGGILKGIMGGELESAEQEQFLGGLIGKLFGGRELEAENYVQEQFLGGILKGLIGGELEAETAGTPAPGPGPMHGHRHLLRRARRFVRYVHVAACHAAAELANLQRAGHRPSPPELQRIVLGALIATAQRLMPRLSAVAFPGGAPAPTPAPRGVPGAPGIPGGVGPQPTMLEMMIADATPLGAGPARLRNGHANGYPLG
jgi:hypothetical protein